MVIIEDTRNQIGKHDILNEQLSQLGHQVIRSKLFVGDYTKAKDQSVCIDTKKDIQELWGNICGKQHERFRNECIRAKQAEISLIILIEEQTPIQRWKKPTKGKYKAESGNSGEILYKAMTTMHQKYGVQFRQCNKSETAKIIIELLGE